MNEAVAALIPLGLGIAMSFAGSLPPGVISITVMDTAARKSFRDGMLVAAAASFVEFFQALIALFFSSIIVQSPFITKVIDYSAIPVFVGLGLLFLFKKGSQEKQQAETSKTASLVKGFLVSLANMLVIPFWIFWSAYFATNGWIDFRTATVFIFSAGITCGTFLALLLYARVGQTLATKTTVMAFWGRKTAGIIFLGFAAYHLAKMLLS